MRSLRLLAMLLLGCACHDNDPQYLDQPPPEDPPSYRPLWLILKSYLAVMIVIVAVVIILFMMQSSLMKFFDSIGRCCSGMAKVRKRLVRNDEEEAAEQKDVNDNECINEQRFCKVSTLRMIDDVTPRLSFSDRQSEYQTFAPAPKATFARAETMDSEFSAELIQSIKNRHGEPTPV